MTRRGQELRNFVSVPIGSKNCRWVGSRILRTTSWKVASSHNLTDFFGVPRSAPSPQPPGTRSRQQQQVKAFFEAHSPAPRKVSSSDFSCQSRNKSMAAASSSSASPKTTTERRGIPGAQFVEDVETYLCQTGFDVNSALAFLQERLQQYKLVEMKLLAQQRDLQAKIPDIEKCLDVVATLQAKKSTGEALIADFEVSEGIYSRARTEDNDSVCLWLGANVMLEYSCEEVQ
ncbi:hypothetical protein CRYUN_Cryun40dG0005400 [Craigia yunnanensis]